MHKKIALPKKNCLKCGLEFSWRKKWTRDWDQVKYCSERCRRSKEKNLVVIALLCLMQANLFASTHSMDTPHYLDLKTEIITRTVCEDIPPHKHFFNSAIYLIEGRVFLTLAGETTLKKAGDNWIEPRDVLHSGKIDKTFSPCAKIFAVYHHIDGQPISYND